MNKQQNKRSKINKSKQLSNRITQNSGKSDIKLCLTGLPTTTISTSNLQYLLPIQVGTSYNERIANKINVKGLRIMLSLKTGVAALGNNTAITRVIIFQDLRQQDSVFPAVTDLLNIALVNSAYVYPNLQRFKIHFDQHFKSHQYDLAKQINLQFPLNFTVKYSNNGMNSICMNGLYILFLTDNLTNPPTIDYSSQVYYEDA